MAVMHTNCKGVVYHLIEGRTKTGKPRFQFSRSPEGKVVDAVPEGFEITESVNGVVSLTKIRPSAFAPEEIETVEKALAAHPRGTRWKVVDKRDRIAVYERTGASTEGVLRTLGKGFTARKVRENAAAITEALDRSAQYHETLRFTVFDVLSRTFVAERYYYSGTGGWMMIGIPGSIQSLADELLPKLGTNAWFEYI